MDTLSVAERSEIMSRVRSKNTKPEIIVRRFVHGLGYRYRLHKKELPGKPDLVFGPKKKVIFVHGCFWHGHKCPLGRIPKSRVDFWTNKITLNRKRDETNVRKLSDLGWQSLVIWECQLKNRDHVSARIKSFLG